MGFLNGWGGNISRVFFVGFAAIAGMACMMSFEYGLGGWAATTKVLEIFLLFGYTNHTGATSEGSVTVLITALMGVFWFAIAIPTVVGRLTRIR